MRPTDALDLTIANAFASSRLKDPQPGRIVSLMPVDVRSALSALMSEDAGKMRPVWLGASPKRRGRFNR